MGKIVLCGSVRTPIGAFLGTLSDISTVELGTICAQESIRRAKVPLDQVDEVIIGHVLAATQGKFPIHTDYNRLFEMILFDTSYITAHFQALLGKMIVAEVQCCKKIVLSILSSIFTWLRTLVPFFPMVQGAHGSGPRLHLVCR